MNKEQILEKFEMRKKELKKTHFFDIPNFDSNLLGFEGGLEFYWGR